MSLQAYKPGTIDCTTEVDLSSIRGKSVVITGGAKGMGEDGVRAFVSAGAYVTFGDTDAENGEKLEKELGSNAKFITCDVTSWEDQLAMFRSAIANSPRKCVDIVVANAGISGPDPAFTVEDSEEPTKPELKILAIDLIGVIYTLKLARHYFSKNPLNDESHDRCFIVNASLVGFLDVPGILQYMASKWGCRALMRCVRRTTVVDGVRMNLTGPWYVGTTILSPTVQEYCKSKNIVFAESRDAAAAWLKIASDSSINGRSFAIVPRDMAPKGYFDIGKDDYSEGETLDELQDVLLRTSHRLQVKAEDQ
ncbi:related to short-chain alcohol dehydrogenase [Fusarium fujikuroi]|nr:related to short-chain alcohol dehydrogenase [Fusarium fujikuroi]